MLYNFCDKAKLKRSDQIGETSHHLIVAVDGDFLPLPGAALLHLRLCHLLLLGDHVAQLTANKNIQEL